MPLAREKARAGYGRITSSWRDADANPIFSCWPNAVQIYHRDPWTRIQYHTTLG